MNVYLVRHGEAMPSSIDPKKPLSKGGEEQVKFLIKNVKNEKQLTIKKIYHSGILRALQTAQIILDELSLSINLEESHHLKPESDPSIWSKQLEILNEDTMLVGHLPYMERLAYFLLKERTINFNTANMASFRKDQQQQGYWKLSWKCTPLGFGA